MLKTRINNCTIFFYLFSNSSWISWPLAFLFQGTGDNDNPSKVPIRFRHLDTKVSLKAKGIVNNGGGQSPSPERENKSPKRSPTLSRRQSAFEQPDQRKNS